MIRPLIPSLKHIGFLGYTKPTPNTLCLFFFPFEGSFSTVGHDTETNRNFLHLGTEPLAEAVALLTRKGKREWYLPQLLSPSPSCTLMKFSIQKGSQTQRLVKELQCPCSEQFNWQAGGGRAQSDTTIQFHSQT